MFLQRRKCYKSYHIIRQPIKITFRVSPHCNCLKTVSRPISNHQKFQYFQNLVLVAVFKANIGFAKTTSNAGPLQCKPFGSRPKCDFPALMCVSAGESSIPGDQPHEAIFDSRDPAIRGRAILGEHIRAQSGENSAAIAHIAAHRAQFHAGQSVIQHKPSLKSQHTRYFRRYKLANILISSSSRFFQAHCRQVSEIHSISS